MEISLVLAEFWGWYLIIFFIVLTFNPKRIRQIFEDLKDQKFVILAAFMAIIIGLINILLHNEWEADWRFIVTALGWISLLFGLSLFTFPAMVGRWLEYINVKLVQLLYMTLFFLGVFLLNQVYQIVYY